MKVNNKKRKNVFIIIIIIVLLLSIIWIIPTKIIKSTNKELAKRANININNSNSLLQYNILDLIKLLSVDNTYIIETNPEEEIIYQPTVKLLTKIKNYIETSKYEIQIFLNDEEILCSEIVNESEKEIIIEKEGKNVITCVIKKDNIEEYREDKVIYYIKPYTHQFLEEYSNIGLSTHFGLNSSLKDDIDYSIELLNALGVQNIRDSIRWDKVYKNNKFNFEETDNWINKINDSNIKITAILAGGTSEHLGDDWKINNEEELYKFQEYVAKVSEKYDYIDAYEILNEPNGYMTTDEEKKWYSRIINSSRDGIYSSRDDIIAGALIVHYKNEQESIDWMKDISNYLNSYKNINAYSYHPYASLEDLKLINNAYKIGVNNLGGFTRKYITEYGKKTSNDNDCSDITIQQSVINQANNVELSILYQFRTSSPNNNYDYGLLNYDYTPKPAYYAMKNYYENTNGSEYIGIVNLADGIEAHVYDKDGKPKIIAWATNSATVPYEDFIASDIYGNEIENINGTLTITTSPVYLDNVSTKYFYEAISNTVLEKYSEFEEKYSTEIASINGMQEQIDKLKYYMTSISNNTTETQENAIEMMSEHFAIGTTILNAFNNGKLDIEYVQISSMLDMLNDIGDSYEDLLTISATTREAYYTETQKLIDGAEKIINDNEDIDIVYPAKILDFARELHEKSEYINGLEEENDIKTGLIVSNSLHAYYLADWANDFANIYIDKYIKEKPVTVSYSNIDEFTNQDITVTLNIGTDSKITNNNGQNTYTFTRNGAFTFEYERRGQAFKEKVKVTSIDKDAPVITGAVNGKIYTESATPVIQDENLSSIEVLFNGIKIQYNNGTKLTQEGIYNIIATDKAGNTTAIEMYIVEEGPDGYIVQNNYILNVRQKTTVKQFADEFNLSSEYSIIRNDTNLSNDNIIATGDVLELRNGATYTIIVAGDINCDGKVTTYDLSTLRRYILNLREFNELESLAADINVDGQELGVKDYSRMRIEILGRY